MPFKIPKPLAVALVGVVFIAATTWACLNLSFGGALERLSYDLPYAFRSDIATPELCLVTMDEEAAAALGQPFDGPWDRRLHAQLLRKLKAEGARAVLVDVVFDAPGPDASADAELAEAIRAHGQVFLGGALRAFQKRGFVTTRFLAPQPVFREAAAGWGLLAFRPLDPDFGVRQIFPGNDLKASATWVMAQKLAAPLPAEIEEPPRQRWMNYYSPPGRFHRASFHEVLTPGAVAPGFFKDRLVVVGGQISIGSLDLQKDEFLTPHTRWGQPFASGMEIHATALLNLLRGEWLDRAPRRMETGFTLLFAIAIAALLAALRPKLATLVALGCTLAIAIVACWTAWHHRVWWNWFVPAGVVTPLALIWSLGANYALEARRRAEMHRAFTLYFSKNVADQIVRGRFNLTLRGELTEATMMFTDLEGFTDLSEQLKDPREIADILVDYFNNTTRHVIHHHGTVIKYAGDAIFAAWGAPDPDASHADHAIQAAWDLHQHSKFNVRGHQLFTRIGVNTGRVVAGNLGADLRFDYTLTGDPVNFASRLEGLNKFFGTGVLISESTLRQATTKFAVRSLGRVCVKGKEDPVEVFELLGPEISAYTRETMDIFARGVAAYCSRDFPTSRKLMEQVLSRREGRDGPAEFYLKKITAAESQPPTGPWTGVIEFHEK